MICARNWGLSLDMKAIEALVLGTLSDFNALDRQFLESLRCTPYVNEWQFPIVN